MKKIIFMLFMVTLHIANANSTTKTTTILFLGDSLTEGFGVNQEDAFPSLVETLIETELNTTVTIINGGVSGSTTSDGLARLKWYLKKKPSLMFLALGANDGLRGLDLKESQKNLEEIIRYAQEDNVTVLLAGMLMPPNYGVAYTEDFKKMYEEIAVKYELNSMSFLLEGVAGEKALNQRDGIHPNEEGHKIMAKNVFAFIKEYL